MAYKNKADRDAKHEWQMEKKRDGAHEARMERQRARRALDKKGVDRKGKDVAIDGTITGAGNTAQPFYRTLNTGNIDILPTKFVGNAIVDNTIDGNVLIQGRPWQ